MKPKRVAAALAIFAFLVVAIFFIRRAHTYAEAMKVPMGTEKSQVLSRLGRPYSEGKCGHLFGQRIPGDCQELIYPDVLAPINPQYVALLFVGDRLVDRHVYSSP
jgi:hypothetical protein